LPVAGALRFLVRRSSQLALAILVCCAAGCGQENMNPFSATLLTQAPPSDSDIVFTGSFDRTPNNAVSEIYALNSTTAVTVRLTQCERNTPRCSLVEAAPASDGNQLAARVVTEDSNGDGRLDDHDRAALDFIDLSRGIRLELVPLAEAVTGVDWSPTQRMLVYNAAGVGGLEDICRRDLAQATVSVNLTQTPDIRERRARFDRNGDFVSSERIAGSETGTIWLFASQQQQQPLTQPRAAGAPLPDSVYRVGSDADPRLSPDNEWVVFRRLTAPSPDGRGYWDVRMVRSDGTFEERDVASGPIYRGAPDWGDGGIIFNEIDDLGSRLVLVSPATMTRRTLFTVDRPTPLAYPRWLR
jgi:hypothetical protein